MTHALDQECPFVDQSMGPSLGSVPANDACRMTHGGLGRQWAATGATQNFADSSLCRDSSRPPQAQTQSSQSCTRPISPICLSAPLSAVLASGIEKLICLLLLLLLLPTDHATSQPPLSPPLNHYYHHHHHHHHHHHNHGCPRNL